MKVEGSEGRWRSKVPVAERLGNRDSKRIEKADHSKGNDAFFNTLLEPVIDLFP